jgi:hypothetical protein
LAAVVLAAGLATHELAATVAVDWAVVFVSEAQPEGTVITPSCVPPVAVGSTVRSACALANSSAFKEEGTAERLREGAAGGK